MVENERKRMDSSTLLKGTMAAWMDEAGLCGLLPREFALFSSPCIAYCFWGKAVHSSKEEPTCCLAGTGDAGCDTVVYIVYIWLSTPFRLRHSAFAQII